MIKELLDDHRGVVTSIARGFDESKRYINVGPMRYQYIIIIIIILAESYAPISRSFAQFASRHSNALRASDLNERRQGIIIKKLFLIFILYLLLFISLVTLGLSI